ncbi:hypothetical protein D3C81_1693340 [compost metagenome]
MVWVAIHSVMLMMIKPEISVRNRLPWCTATARATKKPMVARSPNGSTWLPGTMTAIRMVSGIKIRLAETTAVWPSSSAGSRPIRNSWPPKRACRRLRACLAMGVRPSMIGLITRGISSITAAVFTASCRMPFRS